MDLDESVTNYFNPNNSEYYDSPLEWGLANENKSGPASYKIHPLTGDLSWDSPGNLLQNSQGNFSEYNLALLVEEWRQVDGAWIKLGYVTRDFLVNVTPDDIGRPDFDLPQDRRVTVAETIQETITFQDPDGDPIKVEFFGEAFDLTNSPMTVSSVSDDFISGPVMVSVDWTTLAEHARNRPYYIHFKITDKPLNSQSNPSVSYRTWILSFDAIPDVITALPGAQELTKFVVYPNPTTQILQWQNPASSEPDYLAVYNSLGQRTISLNLTSYGVKEIDVINLVSGLYLLQLTDGKKKYQARFLKN
jgi:hypothetical protein